MQSSTGLKAAAKKLFEKARWTSLSWEEEWNLVYFKSTIAAEIMAGGAGEIIRHN